MVLRSFWRAVKLYSGSVHTVSLKAQLQFIAQISDFGLAVPIVFLNVAHICSSVNWLKSELT
jgi:hypothetical protein